MVQSYKQIRVHLDPYIHHLAGYPLELPQGPLGVPGPHFKNRGCKVSCSPAGLKHRRGVRFPRVLEAHMSSTCLTTCELVDCYFW